MLSSLALFGWKRHLTVGVERCRHGVYWERPFGQVHREGCFAFRKRFGEGEDERGERFEGERFERETGSCLLLRGEEKK